MTVVLALSDLKYNESYFEAGKKINIEDEKVVKHLISIGAVEEADSEEVVAPGEPTQPPVEE